MPPEALLYATAYHPVRRQEANQIEMWPHALAVGRPLPVVPLGLCGAAAAPLDLD